MIGHSGIRLAALLMLVAAAQAKTAQAQDQGGAVTVATVLQDADACVNRTLCEAWGPFARATDAPSGPVYWVLSDRGTACAVTQVEAVQIHAGDQVRCAWRHPRRPPQRG